MTSDFKESKHKIINITTSDLINNNFDIPKVSFYDIKLTDDRLNEDGASDFKIIKELLLKYFNELSNICFYNLRPSLFGKIDHDAQLNRMFSKNRTTPRFICLSNYDNIDLRFFMHRVEVPLDDIARVSYSNLNNVLLVGGSVEKEYFDSKLLNNLKFKMIIDNIAEQIHKFDLNKIDIIVLVSKFLKENFNYDLELLKINSSEEYDHYVKSDILKNLHPSHKVQTLLINKNAVCSAISSFVIILLRHPLLNIEISLKGGYSNGFRHGFCEVKIGDEYYLWDPTYVVTNSNKMLEYTLKSHPLSIDKIDGDSFTKYSDCSTFDLENSYKNIKDLHISLPSIKGVVDPCIKYYKKMNKFLSKKHKYLDNNKRMPLIKRNNYKR